MLVSQHQKFEKAEYWHGRTGSTPKWVMLPTAGDFGTWANLRRITKNYSMNYLPQL